MCVLCGQLITGHWAETGTSMRVRIERVRLLNAVLAHWNLRLDDWGNRVYVMRNWKGAGRPVPDLGRVWILAEELNGAPLDPLDPGLLARLEELAAVEAVAEAGAERTAGAQA